MEPPAQAHVTRSVVTLLSSVGAAATATALLTTVLGKQVRKVDGFPLAVEPSP